MKKKLTRLEALIAMKLFFEEYYQKNKIGNLGDMLSDLLLTKKSETFDPAAADDWIDAIKEVTNNLDSMTEVEAFISMRNFIYNYYKRTSSPKDLVPVLKKLELNQNNRTIDSGTWEDWLRAIENIPNFTYDYECLPWEMNKNEKN